MKKTSKVEIKTKATTFPAGTEFEISFPAEHRSRILCVDSKGARVFVHPRKAKDYFGAPFTKEPSLATIQKWEWEKGICKTITGQVTEPDGTGVDGSPSWALVLGVI